MSQERIIKLAGREARIISVRVQHANKAWGFYNRVVVRFLDNNETHTMGAAQFAKWSAKLEREFREETER